MGTNLNQPTCQTLAERAGELSQATNQLIADIESDVNAPPGAAFHAMEAYVALGNAMLSLEAAARELAVRHYSLMAVESSQEAIRGVA
ncbi:hypothetical protein [Luteibacter sp. SG786]|uniref:hypothetical protein n=1 Tax=Luteibacter sp. SG786 TaxID=2587130 RepID=UPI00142019CD|nr:hypothetical protein [Luteibacter sp. SG786]NII53552.1 hypothetical protein [Luteibacter sp. SG786]